MEEEKLIFLWLEVMECEEDKECQDWILTIEAYKDDIGHSLLLCFIEKTC